MEANNTKYSQAHIDYMNKILSTVKDPNEVRMQTERENLERQRSNSGPAWKESPLANTGIDYLHTNLPVKLQASPENLNSYNRTYNQPVNTGLYNTNMCNMNNSQQTYNQQSNQQPIYSQQTYNQQSNQQPIYSQQPNQQPEFKHKKKSDFKFKNLDLSGLDEEDINLYREIYDEFKGDDVEEREIGFNIVNDLIKLYSYVKKHKGKFYKFNFSLMSDDVYAGLHPAHDMSTPDRTNFLTGRYLKNSYL